MQLVMDDGNTQLVLAGLDGLSIKRSTTLDARGQIADATGIPADNVLIAASHTHNGGPIADVFMSESDAAYCDFVAAQIAHAAIEAYEKREPATLVIGAGHEGSVCFQPTLSYERWLGTDASGGGQSRYRSSGRTY